MLPMTKGFTGHGACYIGRNDDIGSSFRSRDNAFGRLRSESIKYLFNKLNLLKEVTRT